MADFILTPILNSTIGWLVDRGRTVVANRLRQGDVFQELLCSLVTTKLDGIKSKLDGLARKDLRAAISAYNEGVRLTTAKDEFDVPGPGKRPKLDAKKRFEDAQKEARAALSNTGLKLEEQILAVYIRVMARLCEAKDDPARALVSHKLFIEEMHALEKVKGNFKLLAHDTSFKENTRFFLRTETRLRNIILSVYQMNRIVFDITQMIGVSNPFSEWPTVTWDCDCPKCTNKTNPLHDERVTEILRKEGVDMEVFPPFDMEDAPVTLVRENVIVTPRMTPKQCLEVDNIDIKVFDCSRRCHRDSLSDHVPGLVGNHKLPAEYHPVDIETDQNGKVYLLNRMVNTSHEEDSYEVVVLDKDAGKTHTFPLRNKSRGRKLGVNHHGDNTEVLVLVEKEGHLAAVEVYKTDGEFVCQFGEAVLQDAQDIAVANNGHVYVLDKCHESEKRRGVKRKLSYDRSRMGLK